MTSSRCACDARASVRLSTIPSRWLPLGRGHGNRRCDSEPRPTSRAASPLRKSRSREVPVTEPPCDSAASESAFRAAPPRPSVSAAARLRHAHLCRRGSWLANTAPAQNRQRTARAFLIVNAIQIRSSTLSCATKSDRLFPHPDAFRIAGWDEDVKIVRFALSSLTVYRHGLHRILFSFGPFAVLPLHSRPP